jgi:hypothetical protein
MGPGPATSDFYHLVINRLFRDLKVPFRTNEVGVRVEETAVHQALREALVNTLIHADYTGRVSVLVVKRPDMFGFRNPGTMRMPVDAAVRGGVSDCRNRRLQGMFRHVGLGEQAGSGLPKIYASWRQQEWRAPELTEETSPYEQTVFQLRMASLIPPETVASLERRFGPAFNQLSEVQRLALVTVALEKLVTHARLSSMTDAHSRDVTLALYSLVQRGILESSGQHKRTFYFFPGERPESEPALGFLGDSLAGEAREETNAPLAAGSSLPHSEPSLPHSEPSLPHSEPSLRHSASSPPDSPSSLPHSGLTSPRRDDRLPRSDLGDHDRTGDLETVAAPLRAKRRLDPGVVKEVIVKLCAARFLEAEELARLTGRSIKTLRANYLTPLVQSGQLRLRYPENPTHPHQAYAAGASTENGQPEGADAGKESEQLPGTSRRGDE